MKHTIFNGRIHLLICIALLLGSIAVLYAEVQGQGMRVSPLLIETSLNPGEARTEIIKIGNPTEEDLLVQLRKTDFYMTEYGGLEFLEVGKSSFSLASWLALPAEELIVKAGKTESLNLSIVRPKESSILPCWGAIIITCIELTETMEMEEKLSIAVNVRFAIVVLQTEPSLAQKSGRLVNMSVKIAKTEEENSRTAAVSATFVSSCENMLKANVRFKILKGTGDEIASEELNDRFIFPKHKRIFTATFPADDWPPGQYIALAIIDYGGETLTGAQWPFEIPEE